MEHPVHATLILAALAANPAHATRHYLTTVTSDTVYADASCPAGSSLVSDSDAGVETYELVVPNTNAVRKAIQAARDGTLELRVGHECKYVMTGDGNIDCPEVSTFDPEGDGVTNPLEDVFRETSSTAPVGSADWVSFTDDTRSDTDYYDFPLPNIVETGITAGADWRDKLWDMDLTEDALLGGSNACDVDELTITVHAYTFGYANCGSSGGPGDATVSGQLEPTQASVLTYSPNTPHVYIPAGTSPISCP